MTYLSDNSKVLLGTPLAMLTDAMKPLPAFRKSNVGTIVYSLVVQASNELLGSIYPQNKRNSLTRRFWKQANALKELLGVSADDNPLFYFNVTTGYLHALSKSGSFQPYSFPSYMKLLGFVNNLIEAPPAQRSTIGDSIASDQRIETAILMLLSTHALDKNMISPLYSNRSPATSAP